jgi:hypothetical protein
VYGFFEGLKAYFYGWGYFTRPSQKRQKQPPRPNLFILRQQFLTLFPREGGQGSKILPLLQPGQDILQSSLLKVALAVAQIGFLGEADGDSFAVEEGALGRLRETLPQVPQRMAEIQDETEAFFFQGVFLDDTYLDSSGLR